MKDKSLHLKQEIKAAFFISVSKNLPEVPLMKEFEMVRTTTLLLQLVISEYQNNLLVGPLWHIEKITLSEDFHDQRQTNLGHTGLKLLQAL